MENTNIYKHPEWKRLFAALAESLEIGKLYIYDELDDIAGIPIRSSRGRRQFQRFADAVLESRSLHFENVWSKGYRVVAPREQSACGVKRVKRGRWQIQRAGKIASHVQFDTLTPAEKVAALELSMRVARLEEQMATVTRKLDKVARGVELGRLPHALLESGEDKPEEDKIQ